MREQWKRRKLFLARDAFVFFLSMGFAFLVSRDIWKANWAEFYKPCQERWQYPASLPDPSTSKDDPVWEKISEGYRKTLSASPSNPMLWEEAGYFYRLWAYAQTERKHRRRLLKLSEHHLQNALHRIESRGHGFFVLAQVCQALSRERMADQMMARAQVLCPHNLKFAHSMSMHWLQRYKKTKEPFYLSLLSERFRFLNDVSYSRYGEITLALWKDVAPELDPWGNVLSPHEGNAYRLAEFFMKKNEFPIARKYLSLLESPDYASDKSRLAGEMALQETGVSQAMPFFRESLASAAPRERRAVFWRIARLLVESDHLSQCLEMAMRTNGASGEDETKFSFPSATDRLDVLQFAIHRGKHTQALPWLEAMKKEGEGPPQLDFLLSLCHGQRQDREKALEYAQRAFERECKNHEYAGHLFQMLFSLGMAEKVSWYLGKYEDRISRPAVFFAMMARHYAQGKKMKKSWPWIQKAVSAEPANPEYKALLQKIWLSMDKGNS